VPFSYLQIAATSRAGGFGSNHEIIPLARRRSVPKLRLARPGHDWVNKMRAHPDRKIWRWLTMGQRFLGIICWSSTLLLSLLWLWHRLSRT